MKINKKILFKVIFAVSISIISFLYLFFSITSFIESNNKSRGLILLSDVSMIQNKLTSYHLKYGKYPKSDENILINNKVLCDYGFFDEKIECQNKFFTFNNLNSSFTYSNTDGNAYSIVFNTNYDIKELSCSHLSKEKKKGCSFGVDIDGLHLISR